MQLTVTKNFCITPDSVDKSIYYLTLEQQNTSIEEPLIYQPGDWLTVQAKNQLELVDELLNILNLTGQELIELRRVGSVSVLDALLTHLELTQLNPAILSKLQRQVNIGDWASRQEMMDFAQGKDILDLLAIFPQLKEQGVAFLNWLSPLAPRYYSISSAPTESDQVSILYKLVEYENAHRIRFGVASNFLKQLQPNDILHVQIKSNPTFKLPPDPKTPIMMIGAGTGLAPFIGFVEQRITEYKKGLGLGRNLLFFGETYRQTNCLFCEQFKVWQEQGYVETYYAFSRDQKEKVYVQNRLMEQAAEIWILINQGGHLYICGNQTHLAKSVKQALLEIIKQQGSFSQDESEKFWQTLRKQKRIQMDVY
ncbi:MAG TPA: NADP oxidoreductase [Thiomicrospira sp.]|jgi:sulfite reductase (NADPH) flavoprotein alpha-component|nr:NADP oxidoreductase [Thiomicrospira sp.]